MTSKVDAAVRRGMDLSQLGARDHEWLTVFDGYVTSRGRQMLPAGRMHPSGVDADDLAQIGRIGAWKQNTQDPALRTLAAKHDMIDAVRPRGKHELYTGYRLGTSPEGDEYVQVSYATDDTLDDIIIAAYHAGELRRAVDLLPPKQRRYVELRFFKQVSYADLKEATGYGTPHQIWPHARKNLLRMLEHLR